MKYNIPFVFFISFTLTSSSQVYLVQAEDSSTSMTVYVTIREEIGRDTMLFCSPCKGQAFFSTERDSSRSWLVNPCEGRMIKMARATKKWIPSTALIRGDQKQIEKRGWFFKRKKRIYVKKMYIEKCGYFFEL